MTEALILFQVPCQGSTLRVRFNFLFLLQARRITLLAPCLKTGKGMWETLPSLCSSVCLSYQITKPMDFPGFLGCCEHSWCLEQLFKSVHVRRESLEDLAYLSLGLSFVLCSIPSYGRSLNTSHSVYVIAQLISHRAFASPSPEPVSWPHFFARNLHSVVSLLVVKCPDKLVILSERGKKKTSDTQGSKRPSLLHMQVHLE